MNEHKLNQIASRNEFHEAIRAGLAEAADVGASEICLVDPDFQDWPLNDRAVVETLARWADPRGGFVGGMMFCPPGAFDNSQQRAVSRIAGPLDDGA